MVVVGIHTSHLTTAGAPANAILDNTNCCLSLIAPSFCGLHKASNGANWLKDIDMTGHVLRLLMLRGCRLLKHETFYEKRLEVTGYPILYTCIYILYNYTLSRFCCIAVWRLAHRVVCVALRNSSQVSSGPSTRMKRMNLHQGGGDSETHHGKICDIQEVKHPWNMI